MGNLGDELLVGLGMMLVLEGLLYAGFPNLVKRMAEAAIRMPDASLRNFGVIAMIIGIALIWLVRRILA